MTALLQWSVGAIHPVQKAARQEKPIFRPIWPIVTLLTPRYVYSLPVEYPYSHTALKVGIHRQSTRVNRRIPALAGSLFGRSRRPETLFRQRTKEAALAKSHRTGAIRHPSLGNFDFQEWKRRILWEDFGSHGPTSRRLAERWVGSAFYATRRDFQWCELSVGGATESSGPEWAHSPRSVSLIHLYSRFKPLKMMIGMVQWHVVTGQMVQPSSYEAFIGISQTMTVRYAEFAGTATETTLQFLNTQLPRDLRPSPSGTQRFLLSESVVHHNCSQYQG